MSELMNTDHGAGGFRWELLATVSALALLTSVANTQEVHARDADRDRPTVWIEVGGQLERNDGIGAPFAPGYLRGTVPRRPAKLIDRAFLCDGIALDLGKG